MLTKRQKVSTIKDSEFEDLLQEMSTKKSQIEKYLYWDSEVCRAINDHVVNSKDCVIVQRPGVSPHSISFRDAYSYSKHYGKDKDGNITVLSSIYFAVEAVVSSSAPTDDAYYSRDDKMINVTISVPFVLVTKFSKTAFNNWLKELKTKRDKNKTWFKDINQLEKLIKKYPDTASDMIKRY